MIVAVSIRQRVTSFQTTRQWATYLQTARQWVTLLQTARQWVTSRQTVCHITPDNQTVGHIIPDSQAGGHVTSISVVNLMNYVNPLYMYILAIKRCPLLNLLSLLDRHIVQVVVGRGGQCIGEIAKMNIF